VELDEFVPFNKVLLDLSRERLAERIKLKRLSAEQTRLMLAALFGEEITDAFLKGIYDETEGNPFFVEEVVKALVESGDLYFRDGRWGRPEMHELVIPSSIRAAILSRLIRLPEQVQETLELAALFGKEFAFETLAAASELDENDLIEALEEAEKEQMIVDTSRGKEIRFSFTHALIPSSLRENVRTLRRRKMHLKAAEAIEKSFPDQFENLAYQYGEAGDHEKALDYFELAGDRAEKAYANQDAERYYRSALDIVQGANRQADLLVKLGLALERQSLFSEAIERWQQAAEIYLDVGELDQTALSFARMARAASESGDGQRALEYCQKGLELTRQAGDGPGRAYLLQETSRTYYFLYQGDQMGDLGRQALEMAERVGAVEVQVETLTTLALSRDIHWRQALSYLPRAVKLAEEAGRATTLPTSSSCLALNIRQSSSSKDAFSFQKKPAAGTSTGFT
jgi:eukaryotic-like serine/threonine-protein kinase